MAVADPCEGIALGGRQLGLERDLADHAGRDGEHASARFGDGARGGPDLDAGIAPAHLLDGVTETDAVAEPLCERQGQALVAAGDAGGRLVADVRDALEVDGGHLAGRACGRDLETREHRRAGTLRDRQFGQELLCARTPVNGGERLGRGDSASSSASLRSRRAARGARTHPLVGEGETKLVGQRSNLGVAGRMNSAPISATAPLGSRTDHVRPPTRSRASSTWTDQPRRASRSAATRPASPAPITTTRLASTDGEDRSRWVPFSWIDTPGRSRTDRRAD